MLPGAGYNCDMPLMYYISQWIATNYADLLQVRQYNGSYTNILQARNQIQNEKIYTQQLWVAKSMGTSITANFLNQKQIPQSTPIVWLTPLVRSQNVFQAINNNPNPSLIIIGTQDQHYHPQTLKTLQKRPNVTSLIIPDATHSLEYRDKSKVLNSLQIMENIIKELATFLSNM